jgi:hypothetical protein
MTRLSRPYQVALVAIGLLAVVWLLALRGHSSKGETNPPTPVPQPAAQSSHPASSSPYTGSAPGVAGLTRAIEKARGAVAQSEANARQLAQKSARASSSSASDPTASTQAQTRSGSAAQAASPGASSALADANTPSAAPSASVAQARAAAAPAGQRAVEGELQHGHTVAILFWDPHATLDRVVHGELQAASGALHGQLTVHLARAREVGAFGSFTRAVRVYGTPTILIVTRHGKTTSVTGLTDAFSLEQTLAEAKR